MRFLSDHEVEGRDAITLDFHITHVAPGQASFCRNIVMIVQKAMYRVMQYSLTRFILHTHITYP